MDLVSGTRTVLSGSQFISIEPQNFPAIQISSKKEKDRYTSIQQQKNPAIQTTSKVHQQQTTKMKEKRKYKQIAKEL